MRLVLGAVLLTLSFGLGTRPAAAQRASDAAVLAEFEAGRDAYESGDFELALTHFRRGYELAPSPAFLYNVATTLDRLRRDEEALAAYEEYAERFPDADDHANVVARVRILREALAVRAEPPPVDAEATQPDDGTAEEGEPAGPSSMRDAAVVGGAERGPLPPHEPSLAPYVLIGAGGLVALVGAVFVVLAQLDTSVVESGTSWADIRDAYDRVPVFNTVGGVLLGVGGAAVAVGLVWAVTGGDGSSEERLALRVGPTSLALEGTF